jgi:hypothetical protein
MPTNPPESTYKDQIRHPAYPLVERAGMILAYMGPGEPPPLPKLPIFEAPAGHVWSYKLFHECNWLQAHEGNVDPQHLSFLHRMAKPGTGVDEIQAKTDALLAADVCPKIDVEETPYGLRIVASRSVGGGEKYFRITNFIMPNNCAFDGGPIHDPARVKPRPNVGYQMHWHIPIDDYNHWKFTLVYCYDEPVDHAFQDRAIGRGAVQVPYDAIRRSSNRYLQDRNEMDRLTFLGMGYNFQDHDRFAVESQGVISNRTREHLTASDRAVMAMRKQLLHAIDEVEAGRDPLMIVREGDADPLTDLAVVSRTIPEAADALAVWRDFRPMPGVRAHQPA